MIRQTLTMGLVADLVAMVLYLFDPTTRVQTALLVGTPSLGFALALLVHRSGRPRAAGWIGVVTAVVGVLGVFSFFWGIEEHHGVFLAVGIVAAGLIMGPRASVAASVVSLLYITVDYAYGPPSWVAVDYAPTRWERFADLGVALVLVGILSAIGMGRFQQLLREQSREQAFRSALLQESPTPTFIADGGGRIVDANHAAVLLCGHPVGAIVGSPLSRWLQEGAGDEPATLFGAAASIPVRVRTAEVDVDHRARRVVAVVDLRAEQEVLRQQAEAVRVAEEASHAKSAFLANMSHELRTPLNAIIGYAELLGEDTVEPGQIDDLSRILAAGRHLLELVDDVLDMSKIEAGRTEIQWASFDLVEVLHDAVNAVEGEAVRRRIRLEVRAPDQMRVRADRLRVRQVVLNVLSNAARFARSQIVLEAVAQRDLVRVTCADDGDGVPPELAARLFQPFVRGSTAASRTGLGLALSREFAERMGGTLRLADAGPLPGAVFVLELQRREQPNTGTFAVKPERA